MGEPPKNMISGKLPRLRVSLTQYGAMGMTRAARGLIVGVLLARHLGPDDFGIYAAAIGIITIIFSLLPMGLDSVLVREMSQNARNNNILFRQGVLIRTIGFVLCCGLTALYLSIEPKDKMVLLLMGCLVAGEMAKIFMAKMFVLETQHQFKDVSRANIIGTIIGAALALYGIAADMPMWFFAIALTADTWSTAALMMMAKPAKVNQSNKKNIATIHLLREGLPYILTGAAIIMYMKIDVVMLESMRGNREAGLYAAAVRASEVLLLVPITYVKVIAPRVYSETGAEFKNAYCNATCTISRLFLIAGVLFAGLGYVAYEYIYTEVFIAGRPVFLILCAALVFTGPGLIGSILIVQNKSGWQKMASAILAALGNVLINYLLIPTMGMYGAAIATFVSYGIAALLPLALSSTCRWAIWPAIISIFGFRYRPDKPFSGEHNSNHR